MKMTTNIIVVEPMKHEDGNIFDIFNFEDGLLQTFLGLTFDQHTFKSVSFPFLKLPLVLAEIGLRT